MKKKLFFYILIALAAIFYQGVISAATVQVSMANLSFQPNPVRINVGDSVVWINNDLQYATPHTSTSGTGCAPDGKWDTGTIDAGQSSQPIVFNSPGDNSYYCTFHCGLGMTGTVIVSGGASTTTIPANTTTTSVINTTTTTVAAGTTTTSSVSSTTSTVPSACPLRRTLHSQADINTLRQARNVLLKTPYGTLLTAQYYKNAFEIMVLLENNPELQQELRDLVQENRDAVQLFIKTRTMQLSADNEARILCFLETLKEGASILLARDLEMIQESIKTGYFRNALQADKQ